MENAVVSQSVMSGAVIQQWLQFAAVSDKSIATYTACLRQLNQYFLDNGIKKPARSDLETWRDNLINAGKSAATVQLYLAACRLFFRYTQQAGLYPNIADNLKCRVKVSSGHKRDALSVQQAKALLKSVTTLRDKAIVALMLTAGLRSIEVVRANIADIRYINGKAFLFVQGKGRSDKADCVLLAPKVLHLLRQYLSTRGKVNSNQPLFASTSHRNSGGRLSTQSVSKMVKSHLRQIGLDLPTLTCHSLRHTAATVMFLQHLQLTDIQQVLRHKNVNTTLIYLNCINRQKNLAENVVAQVLKI